MPEAFQSFVPGEVILFRWCIGGFATYVNVSVVCGKVYTSLQCLTAAREAEENTSAHNALSPPQEKRSVQYPRALAVFIGLFAICYRADFTAPDLYFMRTGGTARCFEIQPGWSQWF